MTEELKRIQPAERYTLESGEVVSVSPVPFGKLRIFGETFGSITVKFAQAGIDLAEIKTDDVGRIFVIAFEEIVGLMGLVLDKPREWFDTITLADGVGLLSLIIEQNWTDDVKKKLDVLLKQRIPSIST